jgi:hypothetical protein
MADAIPTWTQPVSPGGNWDDVRICFFCLSERDLISPDAQLGSGTCGRPQEGHGRVLYQRGWETAEEARFTNSRTGKC